VKPNAKNVWFTADTHFNHAKIIEHALRPFRNLAEMDEQLIKNWNDHVLPKDDVFHMGDWAWREAGKYRERLNGNIHLTRGNHEAAAEKIKDRFNWVKDVYEVAIREFFTEEGKEWSEKQRIWLAHYAHRVWPRSHHGVWHLYGHSHGNLADTGDLSMDVGVDAVAKLLCKERFRQMMLGPRTGEHLLWDWKPFPEDYRPISFAEVKAIMSTRAFVARDHHTGKEVGE
jgi:calcineurin-like phosphoesterase family protein